MEESQTIVKAKIYLWLHITLVLLFTSCNSSNPMDDHKNINSFKVVENTFDLSGDYNFTAGIVLSMKRISENEYLFLDFAHRAIFSLDIINNKIKQIGSHGDGPGEYRNPIHFQITGEDIIAFSDISNMSIKFTHFNGNYISQINHNLGGGKNFVVDSNEVFVLGGTANSEQNYYQLSVLDKMGNTKNELFPAKDEYENQLRNLGMGGITLIDDKVYFMNIIEPVIYIFDLQTSETQEIIPFEIENDFFSLNDGFTLMNSTPNELRSVYKSGEMVVFQRMGKIEIDGESFLTVSARKGDNNYAYFIDYNTFEIKYVYKTSHSIIGIQDQLIFESDIDAGTGLVNQISFSITGN